MDEYITAYEYESNVNPIMNSVPILKKNIQHCNNGLNFIYLELFNIKNICK